MLFVALSFLQMIGFLFLDEKMPKLTNPFSFYLVYIVKCSNFVFLFGNFLTETFIFYFHLVVQSFVFVEFFILIIISALKVYSDEPHKKNVVSDYVLKMFDLFYRSFLWIWINPLFDFNANFLLCNSETWMTQVCANNFSFIFGFIGVFSIFANILKLNLFYTRTTFDNNNLLKQNFQLINVFLSLMRFLIIIFFYINAYQTLFFVFLNVFGVFAIYNGVINSPYEEDISTLYLFFSVVYELLAILLTFNYYDETIIGLNEICYFIVMMLPFIYAFVKSFYSLKTEKIKLLNIHKSSSNIDQTICYVQKLYFHLKSNSEKDSFILNGLLFLHAKICTNPSCKLFKNNGMGELKKLTIACIEEWLFKIFISLNKSKASNKKKEIFMLVYCSFLEKVMKKNCFSFYVLKLFAANKSGQNSSLFYNSFTKFHLQSLRSSLLFKKQEDENVHVSVLQLQNFIIFQDLSSNYIKSFKKILKSKIAIYSRMLEGYKNLDDFFKDSKLFLAEFEFLQKPFLTKMRRHKRDFLFVKFNALYSYMILNDHLEYFRLARQIYEIQSSEKTKKEFTSVDYLSGNIILLTASILGDASYMKDSNSKRLAQYFGYDAIEFQSIKTAEQLMPKILADDHHKFIKRFLQCSNNKNFKTNVRPVFGFSKQMYVFPISVFFAFNFTNVYKNDFCMTLGIEKIQDEENSYALCHLNGVISSVSEFFVQDYLSVDWRKFYEKINVFGFFPDLYSIWKQFLSSSPRSFFERNTILAKNEVIKIYCPSNFLIFKDFPNEEEFTEESMDNFFSKHSHSFSKAYVMVTLMLQTFYTDSENTQKLQILILKVHKVDQNDLHSMASLKTKSLKSLKSPTHGQNIRNNFDDNAIIVTPTEMPKNDIMSPHQPFSGGLAAAKQKPEVFSTQMNVKEVLTSEIMDEVDFNESKQYIKEKEKGVNTTNCTTLFNPETLGLKSDKRELQLLDETEEANELNNKESENEEGQVVVKRLPKSAKRNLSSDPTESNNNNSRKKETDTKKKENDSVSSKTNNDTNHGANMVRNFVKSEKYPNLLKKIFFILITQITLFFVLNIVSYEMIAINIQSFREYSQKMLVPDLIIISYSYLVETENLLMLKSSGYADFGVDVLHHLIIELDGHCYDHLDEFLNTMKDPSYAGFFNDGMKAIYFKLDRMQTQNIIYKDFLNVLKERIKIQIFYNQTFIPDIYDLFMSNFRTIIERSMSYVNDFREKTIQVRDQQSLFYLTISLIGLFMSAFLILINFPFLNQYFILLEKNLLLVARVDEIECQTVLNETKDLLNVLNDPAEKYLGFTPSSEGNKEEINKEAKRSAFQHKKLGVQGLEKLKKKILASKIQHPKLSRKFMVTLNGTVLLIIGIFYIPLLYFRTELDDKMDVSIYLNTKLSNYVESVNLAFALELLLVNEIFFNGAVLPNQSFTVIKIPENVAFYKESYKENLLKMETFLNDLSYVTSNPLINSATRNVIKQMFYDDVCDQIDEDACRAAILNEYHFGLNGFWQNYLKESRENIELLTNFSMSDLNKWLTLYSPTRIYRKITNIHIFDHRNFDLIDLITEFEQNLFDDTNMDIKLIFMMGAGLCTGVLLVVNMIMFLRIKKNIISFRKMLILIPYNKLKEENTVYLIKRLDET